ncbi:hypothetical protein IEO21_08931 [Rhodonia placenta]|uniref:Uncharacterized protein n=1 Tax=Rhodonia placenta TaxID=104341 RepID=A0A8H7TYY0_9APHY|nr:hypothetical protein IEO21_08931 [Postia placenta]
MGHKLAAGAGGGAEMTLVDRSEIGYQMRIVSKTDDQIGEAAGITSWGAESVAVYYCFQKQRATG